MTEMQQKLFDKRRIVIDGNINFSTFDYVREVIGRLSLLNEAPGLTIELTCYGGIADHGFWIYDLIRLYEGETTGKVIGFAKSMAAIVLQACDHRQMSLHSYLKVHNINNSEPTTVKEMRNKKKMEAIIKSTESSDRKNIDILSTRTGLNQKLLIKLLEEDRDMDASEAKKLNFVDEII